ncbi:hypothetical protein [Paludisphaera sp.]|uniref:hypothetical protein n=1 Tax=Paludisphaera sp. TaxID=2017432 RepID=UPI00301E608F
MKRLRRLASWCLYASCLAGVADACPVCDTDTGRKVRAGIFGEDFGPNLVVTLAPFPIVLGVAAALHFGLSSRGTTGEAHRPIEGGGG